MTLLDRVINRLTDHFLLLDRKKFLAHQEEQADLLIRTEAFVVTHWIGEKCIHHPTNRASYRGYCDTCPLGKLDVEDKIRKVQKLLCRRPRNYSK